MFKKHGLMNGMHSTLTTIIIILMIFENYGALQSYFLKYGVGDVSLPPNSISLDDPIMNSAQCELTTIII